MPSGLQHRRIPWGRVTIATIISLLFIGGAIIGILNNLNSLFNILSLAFAILSALFAFFQWLFPFSTPNSPQSSPINLPSPIPPITVHVSTPPISQPLNTNIGASSSRMEPQAADLWTVPYRRNPFFTGRESLLARLHDQLSKTKATALTQAQAINGLGGIGKTQSAVEYAYRYRDEYSCVLWVSAATRDTLIADFLTIANRLHLPEKDEQDQAIALAAVKQWLIEHQNWLLILDNVDDLNVISDFLPTGDKGHILITTRIQAIGPIAHSVAVDKMDGEEGALLLLRRARILVTDAPLEQAADTDRIQAEAIVAAMDGLPLALDQAGAYIEETGCGLTGYFNLYQTHQKYLLQRRSKFPTDHPESVATTWSLSFQKIEQQNRVAADLLRLCTFLDPDAIPEEILIEGAPDLGPVLASVATDARKLDSALGDAFRYSLVRRNMKEKTLSMHRLVQAVLKDRMNQKRQRQWAERAVRATNRVFPEVKLSTWPECQRLLPNAQLCAALIGLYEFTSPEADQLLSKAGSYLMTHAQYAQAELLFQQVLAIRRKEQGLDHPDTADSLDNLGWLYWYQGRYKEAEPLFQKALTIYEKALGPDHPYTTDSLDSLGLLYSTQGRYKKGEQFLQQALATIKQARGSNHPDTATSLNRLGVFYIGQRRYKEAESLLQRALKIQEQAPGASHPYIATSLDNLGWLRRHQGKYKEAERLLKRSLAVRERGLGADHLITSNNFVSLGVFYIRQSKYKEAEQLLLQALGIRKHVLGPVHPDTADILNNLGWLYREQRRFKEAELLYQQALSIRRQALGGEHPDVANSLDHLGWLYLRQKKYKEAESLFQRALAIHKHLLGANHTATANSFDNLGLLFRRQGKYKEAAQLYQQALDIYERTLGPEAPLTEIFLEGYFWRLIRIGRIIKATHIFVRVVKLIGLREAVRQFMLSVRLYLRRTIALIRLNLWNK